MSKKCIRAWISGRVQGVFFRASACERALELDIRGYARNLYDGRVEVLACGNEVSLALFVEWLHKGPDAAKVMDVEIQQVNEVLPADFTIR
ncbi:acylphosphatase [Mangrovitalea sediminis]|uniref:acylphosphatase n=1 Tax=Mangrovitalea sediminis TaxID=1982043 RepID=UPI000BE5CE1B|nr:acylphosphatase [Mangrovitalea sediminis]